MNGQRASTHRQHATTRTWSRPSRARERGYALVALLALMTVLAISMMAVAPSLRQQSRRELEKEAIARGEEVAEAIRLWIRYKGTPPTSMDDLVEGVNPPGLPKKIQLLRASAAIDPLTNGEWRTIKANDQELRDFVVAITRYANNQTPPTNDRHPAMTTVAATLPREIRGLVNLDDEDEDMPCDEKASDTSSGPFVGVASRSRCASVINYYGIGRHDKWVFTPFYR
jgi:type II secretory pathway pseudopilin PulG